MSFWRQARAVLLLPTMVAVVVPTLILWWTGDANIRWGGLAALSVLLGVAPLAVGLVLVVCTIRLLVTVGKGTLAPWDPTTKLVVRGPYRHVRNPMISGVAFVLVGEAVVPRLEVARALVRGRRGDQCRLPSAGRGPGLRRRFGADYDAYRANVPRWLPRVRPWSP